MQKKTVKKQEDREGVAMDAPFAPEKIKGLSYVSWDLSMSSYSKLVHLVPYYFHHKKWQRVITKTVLTT